MTFKRGLAVIVTWQVLLLAMGAVVSDSSTSSNKNTSFLTSRNSAADAIETFSDDDVFLPEPGSNYECPAVCPSYPGCPACPSAPPCPRTIPPGYQYYQGLGYYKMHYERKTWEDAKASCEREGGYLVVFNSKEEADLASNYLRKYSYALGGDMHVGFFDVTRDENYITVLGGPLALTGYTVWRTGEPNNVGKENCGTFVVDKGFNDRSCNSPLPFLCELFV